MGRLSTYNCPVLFVSLSNARTSLGGDSTKSNSVIILTGSSVLLRDQKSSPIIRQRSTRSAGLHEESPRQRRTPSPAGARKEAPEALGKNPRKGNSEDSPPPLPPFSALPTGSIGIINVSSSARFPSSHTYIVNDYM